MASGHEGCGETALIFSNIDRKSTLACRDYQILGCGQVFISRHASILLRVWVLNKN